MSIEERFSDYAEAFEQVFVNDNWAVLECYFTADATYITNGLTSTRDHGREAVLQTLNRNVSAFDRRCDTRELVTLEGPTIEGNCLKRVWQCHFTLDGAPDLTIRGKESITYRGDLIHLIEEKLDNESQEAIKNWIADYGSLLAR